jgi:hypothetical protein
VEVNFLDDKLAFLVLLAALVSLFVSPTNKGFASLTEKIRNAVQACYEKSILGRANINIDALIKEICSSVSSVKALADNIIMRSQVRPALTTRVDLSAVHVNHGVIDALRVSSSGSVKVIEDSWNAVPNARE